MKYFNQNNYGHVAYPSKELPNATIKSGGCGCVCSANVAIFFGFTVSIPALAKIFVDKEIRVNGGTDMTKAAKYLCDTYVLEYRTTNDENELVRHLQSGGVAIANVGGNRGSYKGVFSDGGHYINVVDYDGKPPKPFIVFDVGCYSGKYNASYRKPYVSVFTDSFGNTMQYTTQDCLNNDTANRNPQYYLFSKKEEPRMNKYSYDDTVDRMVQDGVTTVGNITYWEGVLAGKEAVSPDFLRTILKRYQDKVRGK